MLRRLTALLLALLATVAPALAEVFEGTTTAASTVAVTADASGALEALEIRVGQRVGAGERIATLRPERTFASQDGTVSLLYAVEGDSVSGAVLEISPLERYTLHCTVDKAYQSAESTLVHGGETVYVKCTRDGTHRAIGVVTQIDGEEYRVLTLGGELYVGETVYLYRDEAFSAAQRVGIGTVVASDTQVYEADGVLSLLKVAEGDAVERGQLLYETGGGEIAAPVSGIVSAVASQPGEGIEEGQTVVEIVPEGDIIVEIQADEAAAARIAVGDAAQLTFSGQEEAVPGTVTEVLDIGESGLYTVRIQPDSTQDLALGMSVEARL